MIFNGEKTSAHYAPQHFLTLLCNFMWPPTLWLCCCCSHSFPVCYNTTNNWKWNICITWHEMLLHNTDIQEKGVGGCSCMRAVFKQMCLVLFNRSPVLNLEDGNTLKHQSYDSDTSTTVVSTLFGWIHSPLLFLGLPWQNDHVRWWFRRKIPIPEM